MARIKELDPKPRPQGPAEHSHRDSAYNKTPDAYTNTVGKAMGYLTNLYGKVIDNPIAERVTNGVVQKGWRALLFTNRAGLTHRINRLGSPTDFQGDNYTGRANTATALTPGPNRTEIFLKNYKQVDFSLEFKKKDHPKIYAGHDIPEILSSPALSKMEYTDTIGKSKEYDPNALNQVIIYNMTALTQEGEDQPFIALQIRPNAVDSRAETSWATIKSMGRNTPMYHYLGSEDTLQINTSWYLKGKPGDPGFNPYWVLNQCRLLKSWSMANGYVSAPPVLYIEWGRADIFQGELWILSSATYSLGNFSDKVIVKQDKYDFGSRELIPNREVKLLDFGLVPFTATQELIFKRVSSHSLLTPEILNFQEPLNSTEDV